MNLATRHYGSATTTTLDLLKEANPDVADINRILAGTELAFPEPGGRSRVLPGRAGLTVLVITTPQMAKAAETQRRLREFRGRDSTLVPRDLGNGQVVYRVVVENLQSSREAIAIADGLGSILVEPPL